MTPNGSMPEGLTHNRHLSRPQLRQATIILPNGKRAHRNVTFRRPAGVDGGDNHANEESPLLRDNVLQSTSESSYKARASRLLRSKLNESWAFAKSKTGRGILKCSLAYLLGSMATFIPVVSRTLGEQQGKHMVATVTVYFHPARSIGSMFEAMLCAAVAFLYAAFVSFSSMGVSIFFGRTLDLIEVGHAIVLVVFCGAGLGFVGWVKQRVSHPLVNISTSLTSLAIITVLTKEGAVQAAQFSDDKVTQVMLMILMGVAATTAVSLLIDPVSARKELRSDLVKVTDSFSDQLTAITRAFLQGTEAELQEQSYLDAVTHYKKLSESMVKNLKEAKYEHYLLGTEKEYNLEAKTVNCMQRLGQNIGGLRSAATTQFLLLAQPDTDRSHSDWGTKSLHSQASSYYDSGSARSPVSDASILGSIDEAAEHLSSEPDNMNGTEEGETQFAREISKRLPPVKSQADIFTRFIVRLGPSMKSLAVTMKRILDELPYDNNGYITAQPHFTHSLNEAIQLYAQSRKDALELLYRNKQLKKVSSIELEADFEEVAASCGYFSFSLLDFAEEMKTFLEILDDLKLEDEERPEGRTWSWLKIWHRIPFPQRDQQAQGRSRLIDADEETALPSRMPSPTERKAANGKEVNREPTSQQVRSHLWHTLGFFRQDDIKFAVKVGAGAALYALPSFLPTTGPFYQRWRGEWGLLSYMLVCAMTLGASNTTGMARFLGTCIGAACAILAWTLSFNNGYLLAFYGWFMSLWTAYIIIGLGKGPMGRFIMLTYNLSALYAWAVYVKERGEDDEGNGLDPVITDIALHRCAAVLSGCLWGMIVTRLVWPISARQKFKDGLCVLWLRMGLVWQRDPLNMLFGGAPTHAYMDLREEFDFQVFLARLEKIRESANHEFALRGPFPDATAGRMLKSTQAMLDAFHAMNVMISKNPRASKGEAEILKYTATERAELSARISHLFQVLASSMKVEMPMHGPLPSVDHTRDRLLAKMFRFRQNEEDKAGATDEDFELLYAYALVTGQLSKEIKDMGLEVERLFGSLNEDLLKLE